MSTLDQDKPQFAQLVSAVLTSTRGMVAVSAFVGSVIIAVIYLVFFQSSQQSSSKPKKRSSPVKRSASKQPVTKAAPVSDKTTAKLAPSTKKNIQANGQEKKVTAGEKKELASSKSRNTKQESSQNKKKNLPDTATAVKPNKASVPKSSAQKELKDRDSEWITVTTKKKPRKLPPL